MRPNYLGPAVDVDVDATVMTISKIDEVLLLLIIADKIFIRPKINYIKNAGRPNYIFTNKLNCCVQYLTFIIQIYIDSNI